MAILTNVCPPPRVGAEMKELAGHWNQKNLDQSPTHWDLWPSLCVSKPQFQEQSLLSLRSCGGED